MGKNNSLIDSLVIISRRNRDRNIDFAIKKQTPIFCAAICLAVKKMSPDVDAGTLKELLIEVQKAIDEHPNDIFRACRDETGVIIKTDMGGNDDRKTSTSTE